MIMRWLQVFLTIFLQQITCLQDPTIVPRYLTKKPDNVKNTIARHFRGDSKVKFELMCSANFTKNGDRGLIFTLFDNFYATIDNEVHEVSVCGNQWNKIFSTKHKLVGLQAVEYKNLGFVVFATEADILHIYRVDKKMKTFYWMHNIVSAPMNHLKLFIQNDTLYLKVTNANQINIYKFVETYFSMIESTSVWANYTYSFETKRNQIIVAGDSELTVLFRFSNEKLEKVHEFEALQFKEVLSYRHKNNTFLVFFHKKKYATRYLWTGEELIFQDEFRTSTRLNGEKRVFYSNNYPYLIATDKSIVSVFLLEKIPFRKIAVLQSKTFTSFLDNRIDSDTHSDIRLLSIGKNLKYIFVTTTLVTIQDSISEATLPEKATLNDCFLTLEKSIYALRSKLKKISTIASNRSRRESKPWSKLEQLQQKIDSALFVQNHQINNSTTLTVNTSTTLTNFIHSSRITINNLNLNKLNKRKWKPKKWLSYTKDQIINGSLKTHKLKVESLKTSLDDLIFSDLLLKTGTQHITGNVTAQHLKSTAMFTNTINNIPFKNIYIQSQPGIIKDVKTFQNFNINKMMTPNTNEVNASETGNVLKNKNLPQYFLSPNLLIDELWVENIDGVNIDHFKKSVYRLDSRDVLQGNFTFSTILAGNIQFKTLAGHKGFLTGSENQTIESSLKIKKIISKNIQAERINGINFKKSVATFGSNIKSPTNIHKMIITKNLHVEDNNQLKDSMRTSTHIIGTNHSDFMQRYNGKVRITGNVYIKNLNILPQAQLLLSGEEFDTNLRKYWTRSTEQTINTQFEALNGISTPHLFTNFINDVNVADYMINTKREQKAAKFYFENIKVKGNVVLDKRYHHLPNIAKILNNSVLTQGEFYVKGKKTFKNVLKIDNLKVRKLRTKNGKNHLDAESADIIVIDPKLAKNLLIQGNMNCNLLQIEEINKINLKKLSEKTVYIDQLNHIPEMNFENVEAKNLTVAIYNGELMNDVIMKVEQQKNISEIAKVIAKQEIEITEIRNVRQINDLTIEQIDFGTIDTTLTPSIAENTTFLKNVEIDNLVAVMINDVDFQDLSQRLLYKSWNQPIYKHATFGQIKSKNIFVTTINDKNVEDFIDISSNTFQEISTNSLKFNSNIKVKDLNVNCNCNIEEALKNLKSPPSQFWRNVIILGNATFWDEEASVVKILENAVTGKENQEITGKIIVKNHISANNMYTSDLLNNILLDEIVKDAFLNNQNKTQVIRGQKTFSYLITTDLEVKNFLNVSTINDIDILEIKDKVIFKSSNLNNPIKGKKTFFAGLETINLQTSAIGNVKPENLVSFYDTRPIPEAVFEYVTVTRNLDIATINNMPFDDFLSNRMLKDASNQVLNGRYFFHNLKIFGNATINQINNISIDRVVFDNDIQTIKSYKYFKNNITIVGNMTVEIINGLNLSTMHSKALTLDELNIFSNSVQIYGPIDVTSCVAIETNQINNIPVDYIFEINIKQMIKLEAETIVEIKEKLSEFISRYLNNTSEIPNQVMYIEKTNSLQLSFPNISTARIIETSNAVLLHIENEENGLVCGLPQSCICPVQQTLQISSEHSINMFLNKGVQRIYTYYDDDMIIHLISNSISTDSYCRTNNTRLAKEVSSLTWNIYPRKNKPGGFFVYPALIKGYINNVEFFTLSGKTYIIIGFSYDPLLDTHNVDCIVLGFNKNENKFEEVDKIPTNGLKILSLFYTSRGVILTMGDSTSTFNSTQTKILRFNKLSEKFEVLRIFPTIGSAYAVGVVLHEDNFIVLATQHKHLYILKYEHENDNYQFFQIIRLNYPILSLSAFYTGGFGISDAYFSVVMTNNRYRIYSFHFLDGWKVTSWGNLDGVKALLPFSLNKKVYLFVPATTSSSILGLVQHDSN